MTASKRTARTDARERSAFYAKITRPSYTAVFPRTRLFKVLDGAQHAVIWISAPPGAGKTTLLSSYLTDRNLPHLWYQLDAGDDDVATFFHYLGLAAKKAAPRYRTPLPHLTAEYLAGLPVFARRYFEALGSRLKPPFVLVLDNYQDVSPAAPLHAVLGEGIPALPPGFTTIVLSRTPPPAEQARLRLHDNLRLIGWEDLQLTLDEVKGIGRAAKRRQGAAASYEELHRRTDGWAAGLVLLLEQDAVAAQPESFDDSRRQALFDYFAGEIFAKLDAQTQNVLLASALLPKMTAPMVAQLTDFAAAGQMLAELNRRNYFTLKHEYAEPRYEYHPLFREFLLNRARQTLEPHDLRALRQKAAALLEADGQTESAADLLLAAEDHARLARLSGAHAPALIEQGRSQVLETWLSRLPEGIRAANPWLSYFHGLCRLAFDPPQARVHFEQAYLGFKASDDATGRCLSWCALVDSFVYEWGNFKPLERWIAEMEALLRTQPMPGPEIEAQIVCAMFVALMYLQPQHPDMPRLEERVRQIILHGDDPRLQVKVGNHLLLYYTWWIGDLAKAELLVETLRAQVERPDVAPLLQITWYTMAAAYYWMSAANADCIACVERGLERARTSGVHTWDMLLCSQGVFASLSGDDTGSAERYLQQMETYSSTSRPLDMAMYYYFRAWYRLVQRNLTAAREFAQMALRMSEDAGARFPAAVMRNDLGRVRFYCGDVDDGLALIHQARAEGRTMNAQTVEYLTFIAEAETALAQNDEAACVAHLRRALAVGRAQQFQNHTWWSSETMARLYAKALAHDIETPYVRAVIAKRRLAPPAEAEALEKWPWPLKIYTLGGFAIHKNDQIVRFTGKSPRKPLELLKALIAFGGNDVNQATLIEALWPELDGDNAQQAFETALYRLRKLLGEEAPLLLKDGRLTLDAPFVWVDSWTLERSVDALRSALENSRAALVDLERGVHALYRGHFLPQETAPWALARREQLRSRFLHTLEHLGRHYEERADWNHAIRSYQRGLEIEPLAETLYYRLMCCYRSLDQPAEALAIYRRCRHALSTLLGIAPSRETEALRAALDTPR